MSVSISTGQQLDVDNVGAQAGPLSGVSVLEFGQFVAGPGAGLVLSDLGASVTKVESPQGDLARSAEATFASFNRGKRSIAINLKDSRGAALARELGLRSDVVIQNLRPGVMERFGLDAGTLRKTSPRLIYASVSGFGPKGPSAERPGFDIAAQAESGMMSINGNPDRAPTRVGYIVVDVATADVVAQAVLGALFARERTGVGATIDVSLLAVAMHLQTVPWAEYILTGHEPIRRGNGVPNLAPAADLVETADGYVVLAAYLPDHWDRFCRAIGVPELLEDSRFVTNELRVKNRDELLRLLSPPFANRKTADVVEELTKVGIVAGAVNRYSQVTSHPDVVAANLIREVERAGGGVTKTIRLPIDCDDWPDGPPDAAPDVGQHSRPILGEAGWSEDEISALVRAGAIVDGGESGSEATSTGLS